MQIKNTKDEIIIATKPPMGLFSFTEFLTTHLRPRYKDETKTITSTDKPKISCIFTPKLDFEKQPS